MSSRDTKIKRTLLESGIGLLVAIYVMSSRDAKIKRTLLESGIGLLVAIYVMSSRDAKIKRTLLESGLVLLAKEYEKNPSYGHTRVHDNMVPRALRALGTKTIPNVSFISK